MQVWCYDLESRSNKLFKTARIGSVEPTGIPWEHGAEHEEGFIDVFRMHGAERHRIRLELGLLAYNLLCEEYPLAERDIQALGRGRWMLDTEVAGMAGVARFVVRAASTTSASSKAPNCPTTSADISLKISNRTLRNYHSPP